MDGASIDVGSRLGKLEVKSEALGQGFEMLSKEIAEIRQAIERANADKEAQARVDQQQRHNAEMAELRRQLAAAGSGNTHAR